MKSEEETERRFGVFARPTEDFFWKQRTSTVGGADTTALLENSRTTQGLLVIKRASYGTENRSPLGGSGERIGIGRRK